MHKTVKYYHYPISLSINHKHSANPLIYIYILKYTRIISNPSSKSDQTQKKKRKEKKQDVIRRLNFIISEIFSTYHGRFCIDWIEWNPEQRPHPAPCFQDFLLSLSSPLATLRMDFSSVSTDKRNGSAEGGSISRSIDYDRCKKARSVRAAGRVSVIASWRPVDAYRGSLSLA